MSVSAVGSSSRERMLDAQARRRPRSPRPQCRGRDGAARSRSAARERIRPACGAPRSGSLPRPDGSRRRRSRAGRASSPSACSSFAGSAGGAGTSSLRLPVVTARCGCRARENARHRSRDCARHTSNCFQQRRDGVADAAPARKRTRRHPPVDQHHRQPPRRARQDQVRPQIGFDEQRQRRLPVIEEARDIARRVVGHILMDDVGAESALRRSPPRSPCRT